jgi:hypothetical protein
LLVPRAISLAPAYTTMSRKVQARRLDFRRRNERRLVTGVGRYGFNLPPGAYAIGAVTDVEPFQWFLRLGGR